MVRRNNKRLRNRRGRSTRNFAVNGSTRAMPFETRLSYHVLSTASAGVNQNPMTIASLLGGDLVGRQVKLLSINVRYYPYNQVTTSSAHYSSQVLYHDNITGTNVPISVIKPLSSTNMVTINAKLPLQTVWAPATSTNTIVDIPMYTNNPYAGGMWADITARWSVARDTI